METEIASKELREYPKQFRVTVSANFDMYETVVVSLRELYKSGQRHSYAKYDYLNNSDD